jgi:SAM-dependent methyltransferase
MAGTIKTPLIPSAYEAWYHTPRGSWIGNVEFQLMTQLLRPASGATLLDVGSGTGYFSRRFATAGLRVTGVDPDQSMTDYAHRLDSAVTYTEGTAIDLPFSDRSFDYATAVTSLCFIDDPHRALAEMWRVSRRAVVLGLLNRHSLLFLQKRGRGSYRDARWDTVKAARSWWQDLRPVPQVAIRSAVFCPSGSALAQGAEKLLPSTLPWGAFLAVVLYKPS